MPATNVQARMPMANVLKTICPLDDLVVNLLLVLSEIVLFLFYEKHLSIRFAGANFFFRICPRYATGAPDLRSRNAYLSRW